MPASKDPEDVNKTNGDEKHFHDFRNENRTIVTGTMPSTSPTEISHWSGRRVYAAGFVLWLLFVMGMFGFKALVLFLWLRWVAAGVELSLAQRLAFFGAMLWKQFWQPLAAICLFFFMLTAHFIGFIAQRKSL